MGVITGTSQAGAVLDFFGNELSQRLPRFYAEHLNSKDGQVPNDHSVDFRVNGRAARLTLVPGTFYPTKTSKPMRRYPGVKEQLVEQALIQHATLLEQRVNGDMWSSVTFTINALGRQLKALGSTMSNTQIRQALDVLSSTMMMLSYGDNLQEHHGTLLSAFGRNTSSTAGGNNGDDIWRTQFHPLIAQSIFNDTSRQCPVDRLRHYSPVGAALLRRIYCIDASGRQPYQFTVQEMKMIIAGLNHVRLAGSMQAIRQELQWMQADHYITCFAVEDIFPPVRGRGRPVPIDYRVTLYPGPQWTKNMKAGAIRQNIIEQRLGHPRSQHVSAAEAEPVLQTPRPVLVEEMADPLSDNDPAQALDGPDAMAVFIADALDSGDAACMAKAMRVVARAKGMNELAKETGLARELLYESFSDHGNPTLKTMQVVMRALGVEVTARPYGGNDLCGKDLGREGGIPDPE